MKLKFYNVGIAEKVFLIVETESADKNIGERKRNDVQLWNVYKLGKSADM